MSYYPVITIYRHYHHTERRVKCCIVKSISKKGKKRNKNTLGKQQSREDVYRTSLIKLLSEIVAYLS